MVKVPGSISAHNNSHSIKGINWRRNG